MGEFLGFVILPLGEGAVDWFQTGMDHALGEEREAISQEPSNSNVPPISSSPLNEIRSIHDVRTLKDCLIFFSLPEVLYELDGSLERVRKQQNTKEDHEACSREIDKKLQRKSLQYHPDRVINRGGTPDKLFRAQKAQIALNTTRTVLSILKQEFLDDLDIDHKYKFYEMLELNSLGNEEEIKKHIQHVLHKTMWLSEIKQVHIIAQIRMFLSESRLSLQSYVERELSQFKTHRGYAFYHLNKCIDGYDKLLTEFNIIREECRKENLRDIESVIKEMEIKSKTESQTLRKLMDIAKLSLSGQFQMFSEWTDVDDYLTLPFVYYVNAMLMCSFMHSKKHKNPFYIMSNKNTNKGYTFLRRDIYLEDMLDCATDFAYEYLSNPSNMHAETTMIEESIKIRFDNCMKLIKDELENRFKTESYVEGGNRKFISRQCSNFMHAATDIKEKVDDLLEEMKNCQKVNEEIQKKYDDAIQFSCMFENNFAESLEQSKVLHEEVSKAFLVSHPGVGKEEINFVNVSDDMGRITAECLELHEEVSKILNGESPETVENGLNCEEINYDRAFIESLEQSSLFLENMPLVTKEKNESKLENKYDADATIDIEKHVDNEVEISTSSKENKTTDRSFVDGKTSHIEEKYSMTGI